MAASWVIAVAGFTGLIGMWLALAWGVRSQRNACCPQRALRERAARQDRGTEDQPTIPRPTGRDAAQEVSGGLLSAGGCSTMERR
jgi:hypothetical protein